MLRDAKKFTIKRSEWLYGNGANTQLLDDEGKKDCIGFFFEASGLDSSQLLGAQEPIDVIRRHNWQTKLVNVIANISYQSEICTQIIIANDDGQLALPQREAALISLFASMGVALTFED